MNPTLVAFIPGACLGLAVALLLLRIAPHAPHAADVLDRLDIRHIPARPNLASVHGTRRQRVGSWIAAHVPDLPGFIAPTAALDLLDIEPADFYARKAVLATVGLLAPATLAGLTTLLTGTAVVLPLLAAPLVALACWFQPDVQVKTMVTARRREFTRFVTTYLELVAVALLGNTTADAALTSAAAVSDSWVFQRIRREYRLADATRVSKWQALERLSDTTGVPALGEMARVMRLAEAHISIRDQLRAACDKLRAQVVTDDALEAERTSARMQAPIVLTILPVLALILIPTVLQLTTP